MFAFAKCFHSIRSLEFDSKSKATYLACIDNLRHLMCVSVGAHNVQGFSCIFKRICFQHTGVYTNVYKCWNHFNGTNIHIINCNFTFLFPHLFLSLCASFLPLFHLLFFIAVKNSFFYLTEVIKAILKSIKFNH